MTEGKKIHRRSIPKDFTGTLKQTEPKQKRRITETITVNDRSTSVSCWTLPMMSKYINFRGDVADWSRDKKGEIPEIERNKSDRTTSNEELALFQQYQRKIQSNPRAQSNEIVDITSYTESEVKSVLIILICEVAKQMNLRIKEEQSIDLDAFPSCRLDYLLTYDSIPIGCVEAKRHVTLDIKAFAQAVIQLLVLQQWAYKHGSPKGVDMTKVPIFNVLSDGRRFILMKLQESKLYVEKIWPIDQAINRQINVRCVTDPYTFGVLFKLLRAICSDVIWNLDFQQKKHCPASPMDNQYVHVQFPSPTKGDIQDSVRLNAKENESAWKNLLMPLTGHSRRTQKPKPPPEKPISKQTIEGPVCLSRTFGTKLADTFIIVPDVKKKKKIENTTEKNED